MADGDTIHSKLSWRYQEPYQELCERKLDLQECAWVLMGACLGDIKKNYGVLPVKLAKSMGESLVQAIENTGENSSVDWVAGSMELERVAQKVKVPHYVKELVLRAGKSILRELRYNQRVDTNDLPEVVVERFFQEVYKSNFEERIPLTPNHHNGLDNAIVMEYIEALRPDMMNQISKWAKKATADEDVKNLRRCPREKVKEIDLGEDLL